MPSGPPLRGDALTVRLVLLALIFGGGAVFAGMVATAAIAELVRAIIGAVAGV